MSTADEPRPVEGIVGRREYLKWAQEEASKQRRRIYEAMLKQKHHETTIRLFTELSMAHTHYLIMSAWYSALKAPNAELRREP